MPSFVQLIVSLHTTVLASLVTIIATGTASAQPPKDLLAEGLQTLSIERILSDIRALSDSSFNGRQAGTEDDLRSAQWVAQEFRSAGLLLPPIQHKTLEFPFPPNAFGIMATSLPSISIGQDPVVRVGSADQLTSQQLTTEFLPILDAPSVDVQGRLAFVGYGIADLSRGIDDYAGVDVNNHIVLFLRGMPKHYPGRVDHADKVRWAKERGALAYLTATGPVLSPYEVRRGVTGKPTAFYSQLPPEEAIPGAWISTEVAERLIGTTEPASDQLRGLQQLLNESPTRQSRNTDQYVALHWNSTIKEGILVNAVGIIPGTGTEAIVVGAHRDHFGKQAGLLFPGADDNASGTAVILEVARTLMKIGFRPKRTLVFVSFSGEERDMLGSRLYTREPPVPLGATKGMINVDHAGIGNGRLTVGVSGYDKGLARDAGETAGLANQLDLYGFFPGGDHVPFKEAGVPTVAIVSGGIHPHFHQPTDTAETLNQEVLQIVARYVFALTWKLANAP